MEKVIFDIIRENKCRHSDINTVFNPITGKGSTGKRTRIHLDDYYIPDQWIPDAMMNIPLVRQLAKAKSIYGFLDELGEEPSEENISLVSNQYTRLRAKHDFPFWAILFAKIKNKKGGRLISFMLNRPQRRLVSCFEKRRLANKPIRLVLLKARQWGGSTCVEMYMAWLQLMHDTGRNAAIIAQGNKAAGEVKGMYNRLMNYYPVELMHDLGEKYDDNEVKMKGSRESPAITIIPQRECEIIIGTSNEPDSLRGIDLSMAHLTEVALWKQTEGHDPSQIVRSVVSGIDLLPLTLIVYESTPNGTGNFFQEEYDAAKKGESEFDAMFVAWWQIEKYSLTIDNVYNFVKNLYENRNNANAMDARHESGQYLWRLWELGATLEAINWYVHKRTEYSEHADMASEYASDDIEAFKHSGARVFNEYSVEKFNKDTCIPSYVGDVVAKNAVLKGKNALIDLKFSEDKQGQLWIWRKPELFDGERVLHRYLVVVDIGGRSYKADWSVIVVFDRYYMMENKRPTVVAQWYGHIDHDLLAWKSAQIAKYYDNALLVIESNTLETKDKDRDVDDDQSSFILAQIKDVYTNLYERKSDEDNISEGSPSKYGFHTNVKTKPEIISLLVEIIREHLYIERDKRCLDEYLFYEKKNNGSFGAIKGKHDDLLMTRAIGMWICYREMPKPIFIQVGVKHNINKKVVSAATI